MQCFDQVRGTIQLELDGLDVGDYSKMFGGQKPNDESIDEPEYARDLMNNHNNQIELLLLQENLSDHDLTLMEYDSKISGGTRISRVLK
jgi:hypothetical protein